MNFITAYFSQTYGQLKMFTGLAGFSGTLQGVLAVLVIILGLVIAHELGHYFAFTLVGVRSKVILMPGFHKQIRAERGRKAWLSLGACHADDADTKSMTSGMIRFVAIAGPLLEAIVAAGLVFVLLPYLRVESTHFVAIIALLQISLYYPFLLMLNWIPIRVIGNDGWRIYTGKE